MRLSDCFDICLFALVPDVMGKAEKGNEVEREKAK